MLYKKTVLKNSSIFKGQYLCWSLFLSLQLYYKETPTQMLSCNYRGILKKICERLLLKNVEPSFSFIYIHLFEDCKMFL